MEALVQQVASIVSIHFGRGVSFEPNLSGEACHLTLFTLMWDPFSHVRPYLVFHLGLPKTASTSLQVNLFGKLGQKGDINYLGKEVGYSRTRTTKKSGFSGQKIRDAVEGKLPVGEVKVELEKVLDPQKTNV